MKCNRAIVAGYEQKDLRVRDGQQRAIFAIYGRAQEGGCCSEGDDFNKRKALLALNKLKRQLTDNETLQQEHAADTMTINTLRQSIEDSKKRHEVELSIARMKCAQGMIDIDECLAQQTECEVVQSIEDKYYEADAECEVESKLKAAQQRMADMRVGHAAELNTLTQSMESKIDADCAAEQADAIGANDIDEREELPPRGDVAEPGEAEHEA